MTPEERFEAHEQWLLDHDRAIARYDGWLARMQEIQQQQADIQRKQSEVLLEIAQHVTRLLDRDDAHGERS
jgi:hypothetical protein